MASASSSVPLPPNAPGRVALAVRATRPAYLLTSVVPALLGCLVAVGAEDTRWALLPLVLLGVLLAHAATNACNDTEDFASGVDQPGKVENSGVFVGGLMTVAQGRRLYAGLFVAGAAIGLLLAAVQTWWLLLYGGLGLLGGWLYTGGPRPFKHVGLGDPFIVVLMGPLLTQGASTAVTGVAVDPAALGVGFLPGFLIAAVLQSNNAADVGDDRAAGVRTLAVRLGEPWASRAIALSLVAAAATPVVLVATGALGPWALLPLLVAPLLVAHVRAALAASRAPSPPEGGTGPTGPLTPLLARTHLLATALLCAGVVLDRV